MIKFSTSDLPAFVIQDILTAPPHPDGLTYGYWAQTATGQVQIFDGDFIDDDDPANLKVIPQNLVTPTIQQATPELVASLKTKFREEEESAGFVALKPRYFTAQAVGAVTIDVATFNIPQNIFGKTRIEVFLVDVVSGNFGIADVTVSWRRFTAAPAIGTVHAVIPLQTPGTLAGAVLPALVVVNNTIVSRFTGVAGRTITVYVKYSPTVLKF